MKIIKQIIYTFLLFFTLSCTNKHGDFDKNTEYYFNGNVKKTIIFKDSLKQSYISNLYSILGNIKQTIDYSYNEKDCLVINYHKNENVSNISHWNNGKLYGISKYFYENGSQYANDFFYDGIYKCNELLNKQNNNGLTCTEAFIAVKDSILQLYGYLCYDINSNIIEKESSYYTVQGPDTVFKDEFVNFNVKGYNDKSIIRNMELYIYDYNDYFEIMSENAARFKSDTCITEIKTEGNKSEIEFKPKKTGYNCISGIIRINLLDTNLSLKFHDYWFYKEFYVNKKEDYKTSYMEN